MIVVAIVFGVGLVAQTSLAQERPTDAERCETLIAAHSVGGAHEEVAGRLLAGVCGPPS
jgi:hypothetical protein